MTNQLRSRLFFKRNDINLWLSVAQPYFSSAELYDNFLFYQYQTRFMDLIVWNPKMSVGIKEIDEQHKHFISMINETQELVKSKDHQKLVILVSELLDYARIHFTTEENYFKKYNYPSADEHTMEHAELTDNAIHFYDKIVAKEEVTQEFLEFLVDWLDNHLKVHDHKYAIFFRKIGISDC